MTTEQTPNKQVLLARQPIFNADKKTVAYELLYRNNSTDESASFDFSGSIATIGVLLNAYTSVYQTSEMKRLPAFINMTYDLLVDNTLPDLPKNQVVLEILEDVEVDQRLVDSVKTLKNKGYKIALDDFIYDDKYIPLLSMAHIVKVDVLEMTHEEVTAQIQKLSPYNVTLLAEKVETHEMFKHCESLGFKLFQGYFLSKPELLKGHKISPGQSGLLRIIQELQKTDVNIKDVEQLIMQDPLFSYKLLRIVNSSAHSLVREINSIMEAISILGLQEIKKWALITVMFSNDDKPDELLRQLLARGRMCEKIAQAAGVDDPSNYMMAGIISGVNALLDIELEDVLEQIPLTQEMKIAIARGEGQMGEVLHNSILFGQGNWKDLSENIDSGVYDDAYRESLHWATESIRGVAESE